MAENQTTEVEGEAIFDYLMRTMPQEDLQKKIDEAEAKQARLFKFKEGKQSVVISRIPYVIHDSKRFQYSNGIGYIGAIKEINNGAPSRVEFPLVFTNPQIWEIIGQVRINFPEWSPVVDRKMEVINGLKIDAETNTWKDSVTQEDRSKTRFEIDRTYAAYEERKVWLRNLLEETRKKDEAAKMGEATKSLNL
jgi:hypothetical protein